MNSYQCLGKGYIKVRQRHSNFSTLSYLKESDSKPLASTHTPTKKSFFLLMDQFSLWFVVLTLFLRKERFFIWKTVIQKTSYVSVRSLFYFIKVIVKRIQSNIFRLRLKKKKSRDQTRNCSESESLYIMRTTDSNLIRKGSDSEALPVIHQSEG